MVTAGVTFNAVFFGHCLDKVVMTLRDNNQSIKKKILNHTIEIRPLYLCCVDSRYFVLFSVLLYCCHKGIFFESPLFIHFLSSLVDINMLVTSCHVNQNLTLSTNRTSEKQLTYIPDLGRGFGRKFVSFL